MPLALPLFDVAAIVSTHTVSAQRGAQTIAPAAGETTNANTGSPSAAPASSPPPASSSSPPPGDAASSAAPRARRHRRRAQSRRAVRRRVRRVRRTERRGPAVVITTRYMPIATEGSPGPAWTARFTGLPLAGGTGAARNVRFALGAELVFRAAPHGGLDPAAWVLIDLGYQYPFRVAALFATGILAAGVGERFRFDHGNFEFAWQIGAEIGADVRPPRSPVGLEVAAGFGRTGWGEQWTLNGWVRFGLAFF